MKIREVLEIVEGELLCGEARLDDELSAAFSADLMSDVLAYVTGDTLLLTGLINTQVIRTVEMTDIRAIVVVRNKKPASDFIELAKHNQVTIICTRHSMYTASGRLYSMGLPGIEIGAKS